jgi:hypothetical protein
MRSLALLMPMIVLGLLLCGGCGGSGSPPPPPSQVRVYSGAGYPFVADFNQDGKADVFTAVTFGDSYGTMNLGAGDGNFQAAARVPLSAGFYVNAVADFNADGKPDLLATNCSSLPCGINVYFGNGDGTFQTTPVSTTTTLQGGVAADLNGDGKADLVGVVNGALFVYLGNGDGTFTAGASYNSAIGGAMALGDFNADGKIDVVISTPGDTPGDAFSVGQVIVFLGNGDGTFQAAKSSAGAYITASIVVEDFNSDGKMDLAMSGCGFTSGCLEWALLGNGDGSLQTPQFFGPTTGPLDGASALGGADFNGDGKADLVLQGDPSFLDTAEIYLGNGDDTFSKTNSYTLGSPPQDNSFGIAVADFNGDGKPDIAASNVVLLGNGDGTFQGKLK